MKTLGIREWKRWIEIYVRREEKGRRVCPSPLGCVEEKNEAAIYRRMERKKKTMKEIKKEKEEKWNVSGR